MHTLAIECSTARGSVALVDPDGATIFRAQFTAGRGHGGELFTALENALAASRGGRLREIVTGLGPGSYSGVRQAVAAATGLALATGAALTGVPSPVALETGEAAYHAVGDARRGTFYHTAVENGVCAAGPELLPDGAALAARLSEDQRPVFLVETDPGLLPPGVVAAQALLPLAERLLRVPAAARTLPPLEPIYLRAVTITLPTPKR